MIHTLLEQFIFIYANNLNVQLLKIADKAHNALYIGHIRTGTTFTI